MCVFCDVLAKDDPNVVLARFGLCFVISPLSKRARKHVLLIPKSHIPALADMTNAERGQLLHEVVLAAQFFSMPTYRIAINQPGEIAHLHVHLMST